MSDEVKRTVLVRINSVARIAEILTGFGEIKGIDHEGTITYEISAENEFELGRLSYEIQGELRSYEMDAEVVSAVRKAAEAKPKAKAKA